MQKILFTLLSFYCISLLGQLPRSSNLIGSYSFTGNANDSSGNNYHGTFTGNPTLTSDRNGVSNSAYTFDGNDYIYTSDTMADEFTNVFTISAWIKSTNNATVDIFGLGQQECNSNAGPVIRLGSNINFNRCNEGFDTPNSNYYYDGVWHHYAFTYSGSQRKVYRDGTLVNTNTKSNIFNINTYGLAIGRAQMDLSGDFFVGSMDEVNVWNIALTDAEVSSVYNYSENNTTVNPKIERSQITLDNSTVSVTFSDSVYGGSANATSTLEVSDFSLTVSGGSASLSSATPSSINVSGTTIGLGIPLTGTPDGSEILTISPVNNSIFSVSGDTVSSTQSSNTVQLISNIVASGLILYLDAANQNSYSGSGNKWYDLSGNNNDFNLNGPTFNLSGYFDFDGTNDYARTVSTLDLSQYDHVTVQINMLAENTNKVELTFEHSENWNSNIGGFGLANQSGGSTYINNLHHTNHDRGGIYRNYEANILNEWHQQTNIFSSVDDPTGRLTYIDGTLLNYSIQPSGSYPTGKSTTNSLNFGNYHFYLSSRAGSNNFLNGKVKSILIYGTKLSSSQIHQNYDALNDIPPTDISLTSNTISETASIGTLIGTLSATDSDTSISSLTFSFTSSGDTRDDDNNSFTISGTSLITSSTLDYETKASYNIYINVSDGTNDLAKAFTVSVTNILEPITDVGFAQSLVVSNGLILHLNSKDSNSFPGNGGDIWYDISGNNNDASIIGGTNFVDSQIVLDGSDNYVKTPTISGTGNSNQSHTIEIIVTPNSTSGNIISMTNSSNHRGWNMPPLPSGNSKFYAQLYNGILNNNSFSSPFNIGVRYHITLVWDHSGGRNFKFFVNNNLIAQQPGASYSSSNNDNFFFLGEGNPGCCRSVGGVPSGDFAGKLEAFRVYNRALTDAEIASNYNGFSDFGGNSTSTVSLDEELSVGTLVANLTATDSDTTSFTFSLVAGDGTNDRNNSSFTISGTQLLVADNIDYETNSTLNIYVQASDGTNTFARALTVNVNDVNEPPVITSTTLAQDNSSIDVTFSEAVNASADASNTMALEVSDFVLSLQGGSATLSATTPLSISANGNTYTLGLPLVGISDGTEVLTVQPAASAIYDLGSAVASTTQSSNTVTLNPPNAAPSDISLSSSSVNENISIGTLVATLSTTDSDSSDTHTYSLVSGAGDTDNASFSINGANLLTAAAVDYESQNSFSILLQTSDGTASYTESFTISVIDGEDDSDGDGFFDNSDAFPSDPSEWSDNDGDGTGDNADTDDDNDGWSDTIETSCGTNPLNSSDTPSDFDQDGNPDCLDPDDDNDTYPDLEDAFPFNAEEWADNDKDGTGDNADTDDDNDGYLDADEIQCESDPLDSSSLPLDFDVDGAPDCIDDNDDNDYCLDIEDDFPLNRDLCVDTDGDGIDNRYEFDSDNDGVADTRDAFPLDPNESQDTDGDGIGDNEDQDDNNDGFSDEAPIVSKVITPNQPGVESTWKIINIEDYPFTTVRVYAPDGSIVFESTNYQNQWRGNNMRTGSPLPTGPYYFRISYGSVLEKFEDGWLYIFN